ncbi:glycosyltransferase family 9 protein [Streptomyces sp. NP160]|uniref:glycosyltransferase family 9 protein n=1 Tax=Streptomyces sp. NP160 TaxID=2586637 RepID=UPI00111A4CE8|nr:glycosyltransferase family 9 protein [Streptomyces sp. NP160]TNM67130.1 glycosyltransferase family 9 protein [Streptomyces sp. NP160]
MTTVLALRALGLGDALTGVPALRGLRRARPDARLVLAGPPETGALLVAEGVVDAVLPVRGLAPLEPDALLRAAADHPDVLGGGGRSTVDLAVNLHGRGPQSTQALAALRPARLVAYDAPSQAAWDGEAHEVERWCALVRGLGGACGPEDLVLRDVPLEARAGPVVVHPGAASPSRRWPAQRWAQVVAALRDAGRVVVVTGGPDEAPVCAQVAAAGADDLCGRLSLAQLLDLVASSPLLLSGDTGAAHVATATRTPSVLLFGPTSPARWGPAVDADRHRVLWRPRAGDAQGDPHGSSPDPVLLRTTVHDVLTGTVD